MQKLPIDTHLEEIVTTLRNERALVLQAPTGAGKTTRVPPALLDARLVPGKVLLIEPRRVAARAAARRMAQERGVRLGDEVGYHVRFDQRAGKKTELLVLTDGLFLQRLQRDPFLEDIALVVFDEFHERRIQSDLALALVRQIQEVNEGLRVVVMSATLDPGPVAVFLDDCPQVESEGRTYPVDIEYLTRPDDRPTHLLAAAGVRRMLTQHDGDVLVFLPGVGEILKAQAALSDLAREHDVVLRPLYGALPPDQQDLALAPSDQRKVVLATNVAETSLTIDGVTCVVDTGYAKVMRFDVGCGLDRLVLERIDKASADQRAGRAGRSAPGVCLRMWTASTHSVLAERGTPDIQRMDLAQPILQLMHWGEPNARTFPWFEPPPEAVLERALEGLQDLGALDEKGTLTSMGHVMATLPVAPRLGRLLIESHHLGQPKLGALATALLNERRALSRVRGAAHEGMSDVLEQIHALESRDTRVYRLRHRDAAKTIRQTQRQLQDMLKKHLGKAPVAVFDEDEALLRALTVAFIDRLARRRGPRERRARMVGGRGVQLSDESVVVTPTLFVCVDLDAGHRGAHAEARVWQASGVKREWLPEDRMQEGVEIFFDDQRQQVSAMHRVRFRDLILDEQRASVPRNSAVADVLADAASKKLVTALGLERPEVAQWMLRLQRLQAWCPELDLPSFDDASLRDILPMLCAGRRSFAELRTAPLVEMLGGTLSHPQRQAIDREAPTHVQVPSGNRIKLTYQADGPPILAVKIQEMYGLAETPRVARGRVPVLLHLLAPNMRPQQITQDLANFWAQTYPEVRKDLRARYAKHAWPEDPLTAKPERRPQRRRR